MARNGSGTMSIPNTFVSGNTITASGHNQNMADIASELTNSVAADGQTSMTGPLKAANGTAAAPTMTFASDADTGAYRSGANEYSVAADGVQITKTSSAGLDVKSGSLLLAGVNVLPSRSASILLGNPTGSPVALPSEITLGAGVEFSGTTLKGVSVVPTIQRFLTGSGTYTTAAGCKWIRIRAQGGGGGGGGGNNSTPSTSGSATTFSGGTLSAGGGSGTAGGAGIAGGAGGSASGGNVANIPGGSGTGTPGINGTGGSSGGSSVLGGGGGGGTSGSGAGQVGATNSGGGGGGGGSSGAGNIAAAGGGAGGYVEHIISAPAATYTYAVGAGGAGATGTSAGNGGAGATGILIVEEYY